MVTEGDEDDSLGVLLRVVLLFALVVAFQVLISSSKTFDQSHRESKRRWQHALTGHALVQISYILPIEVGIVALLIGSLAMAYLRFRHGDFFTKTFGPLLRPEELQEGRLPGAFYFLLGTAATATFFPLPIARYAVECLALADPMAAFVGTSIKSPKLFSSNASLAGCLACFGTAWCVGIFALPSPTFWQLSTGALACTVAEAAPYVNDNLLIPLVTALVVQYFS